MAIILNEKMVDPPLPVAVDASDLSSVEAPPEYTPVPLRSESMPLPQSSQSTLKPRKERTLFQRWIRSPIAISLVFLGLAVIATGIGLTVHFTRNNKGSNNDDSSTLDGSGGTTNTTIDYGPWLNMTQTYYFDTNGTGLTFASSDELMDGVTYVAIGDSGQERIEADVSMQWRQYALVGEPDVDVDTTTPNATIGISCPYVESVSYSSYIVYTNVTLRFPRGTYTQLAQISTGAQAPHKWSIHVANMTEGGVLFGRLSIQAQTGDIQIDGLDAHELDVSTQYGNIGGTVNVSVLNPSDANGVYTLVNLDNSIPNSAAARRP